MFTTIRARLLFLLLSTVFVTVITSLIAIDHFTRKKDSLSLVTRGIENTHVLLLKDIKIIHEFFENETINPLYFQTGSSELLDSHYAICSRIHHSLDKLQQATADEFELKDTISALQENFKAYRTFTDRIIAQIAVRGFKDYGIEGKMRRFAHDLEDYGQEIGLVNILQLRRHEKDFIIRQEDHYAFLHHQLIGAIKEKLLQGSVPDGNRKALLISTIDQYSLYFNLLTLYDKKIGLKSKTGAKNQVDMITSHMENSLSAMIETAQDTERLALGRAKTGFAIIGLLFLAISIISAVFISRRASGSITSLMEKMDDFVKSDFTRRTILPIKNSTNEIDVLTTNFSIMEQHIVNQMGALKQTNKDLEMLFYMASHDIRYPLLTVRELTSRALKNIQDVKARRYFSMLNQSWEKLIQITDEMGMVTDIKTGDVKHEAIDFEDVIRSVFSEFRSMEGFQDIIFSLEIKLADRFCSSLSLIKAIFRNLIENGIKYSAKRSGFSFLRISVTDDTDKVLRIIISDNGIGIKKEYQGKIFDMFFRGTNKVNGTGLGLYIVQHSLEKLNGVISVESEEDRGTTFRILIPNTRRKQNIREQIIQKRRDAIDMNNVVLNYT